MSFPNDETLISMAKEQYGIDLSDHVVECLSREISDVGCVDVAYEIESRVNDGYFLDCAIDEVVSSSIRSWKVPLGFLAVMFSKKDDDLDAGYVCLLKLN